MLKKLILVGIFSIVLYKVFDMVLWFGCFRHTFNHAPGPCRSLPEIDFGSEDIQVLPNGLAFISSGMKFLNMGFKKGAVGKIFLFDFNQPNSPAVELKISAEGRNSALNPHGISVWSDSKTGAIYLYVINHHKEGEAVDKYKFDAATKTLTHMKRFENEPNFHIINNLVVVEEDKFYITNYLYHFDNLEIALKLHWGSIAFYDGHNATIVEEGLLMPNGIALSGRYLYVVHIGGEEIRVYERKKDNSVSYIESIKLWSGMDNVNVDLENGDLWTGGHPIVYKALQYCMNPSENLSPSQVLKIQVSGDKPEITEVYSNDGSEISGSSVAARYKNGLLIGSVFTKTLYCEMKI